MRNSAYPKYGETGVDWLGRVPAHWATNRLKFIAKRKDLKVEAVEETEETPLPYIGLEHVAPWTGKLLPLDAELIPEGVSNRFASGDTLFGKLRPYLAKACNPDFGGLCSSELLVLMTYTQHRQYFLYQLLAEGFISLVDSSTYGAKMPRAGWEFIGSCVLPSPPDAEQAAIADFLDRKTSEIDALVAKKSALIEKLKEKRSALISRTVTRGLPPEAAHAAGIEPNPKTKNSRIPWIGQMPWHWSIKRLRHISDGITVGVVVNPSSYVSDEGVPFLLGGDIREFHISVKDCNRCPAEVSDGSLMKSRLAAGDLVVVRVGYPGIAAVVPSELEGANCASMMIVRKHFRFVSQWLAYIFNSQVGRDQIEIVQYGAAQKQFNISHAIDFSFPFPPAPEQRAIADFLDQGTAKIDSLIAKVEQAIERLQEYRIALITAAVTGKIDVRQEQQEQNGHTGLAGRGGRNGLSGRDGLEGGDSR